MAYLVTPGARSLCAQDGIYVAPRGVPGGASGDRKPLPRGSIRGNVICMDTHTPARGAQIMLMPAGQAGEGQQGSGDTAVSTELDGSFSLSHVAPGEYFVLAFAPGYLSPIDGIKVSPDGKNHEEPGFIDAELRKRVKPVLVSGAEAVRADIELVRGAVLTGRVVYSDGSPATHVKVLLQHAEEAGASSTETGVVDVGASIRAIFQQAGNSKPDDQGHFRLPGIPPGKYRLAVTQMNPSMGLGAAMEFIMDPGKVPSGTLTVYSGNTLHKKQARVFELAAGDTVDGIDIVLPLNGLHSVSGVIAGKDGVPVDWASLDLSDTTDSSITFHTTAHTGGEFHFAGVPEGTYELKSKDGRIYQNATSADLPEDQVLAMDSALQAKRAFAATSQSVIVKDTDLENVNVTPAETKLPEMPTPARGVRPGADEVPE